MGEGHVPNLYYRCINRIIMHPLPKTCHESGVNAQVIDTRVWSKLTKFFKDSELVKKQFETFLKNKEQGNQMTEDTLKLEKQLTALSEEEQRYITAYGSGVITVEQLKSQTDTIQRRIKEIRSRIDQVQNLDTEIPTKFVNIKEICNNLSSTIKNFNFEQKQLFVTTLLTEVIVGSGQKVVVRGVLPTNFNQFSYILPEYNNKYHAQDRNRGLA